MVNRLYKLEDDYVNLNQSMSMEEEYYEDVSYGQDDLYGDFETYQENQPSTSGHKRDSVISGDLEQA